MTDLRREERQQGFRVYGRVQGVGFRWWTRETARKLDVRGTVANRPDGAVEVHVIGTGEAVELFAEQLTEGPWGARVDEVVSFPSDRALPRGFEIG